MKGKDAIFHFEFAGKDRSEGVRKYIEEKSAK